MSLQSLLDFIDQQPEPKLIKVYINANNFPYIKFPKDGELTVAKSNVRHVDCIYVDVDGKESECISVDLTYADFRKFLGQVAPKTGHKY